MNFKSFITESKQVGILYHYTSFSNGLWIIKSNTLKGSISKPSFVSLTRDKSFHKQHRIMAGTDLRLVLDGDKLSTKYKIKPHDFGAEDESEERILTTAIIDIKKYLIRIDLYESLWELQDDESDRQYSSLKLILGEDFTWDDYVEYIKSNTNVEVVII